MSLPDLGQWLQSHRTGDTSLTLHRDEVKLVQDELQRLRQSNDRIRKQNSKLRKRIVRLKAGEPDPDPEDPEAGQPD